MFIHRVTETEIELQKRNMQNTKEGDYPLFLLCRQLYDISVIPFFYYFPKVILSLGSIPAIVILTY